MRPEDGGYPRKAYARLRERNVLPASFVPTASVPKQAKAEPASSAFREGPGQGEALPAKSEIVPVSTDIGIDNFSGLAPESQSAALRVPPAANSADLAPTSSGTKKSATAVEQQKATECSFRSPKMLRKQLRIALFEATAEAYEDLLAPSDWKVVPGIIERWCAKVPAQVAVELADECRRLTNLLIQAVNVIRRQGDQDVLLTDLDAQLDYALDFVRRFSGRARVAAVTAGGNGSTRAEDTAKKSGGRQPYRHSRISRKRLKLSFSEATAEDLKGYEPTSRCKALSAILEWWGVRVVPEAAVDLAVTGHRLGNRLNKTLHEIHRDGLNGLLAALETQVRDGLDFIRRLSGGPR
jgi:hypothetical protein